MIKKTISINVYNAPQLFPLIKSGAQCCQSVRDIQLTRESVGHNRIFTETLLKSPRRNKYILKPPINENHIISSSIIIIIKNETEKFVLEN